MFEAPVVKQETRQNLTGNADNPSLRFDLLIPLAVSNHLFIYSPTPQNH